MYSLEVGEESLICKSVLSKSTEHKKLIKLESILDGYEDAHEKGMPKFARYCGHFFTTNSQVVLYPTIIFKKAGGESLLSYIRGFLAYFPQLDDEELECYKEDTFEDLHCIGKTLANLYIKSSLIHRDLHYNNIFVYIDPNEAGVVSVTLIDYADLSELDENRLPHEDVHKLLYHSHELMSHCQADPLFEGAFQQLEDGYNLAFSEAGLSWKRFQKIENV